MEKTLIESAFETKESIIGLFSLFLIWSLIFIIPYIDNKFRRKKKWTN
jgi:hypothetical protein